jgi:hypothetical protein
MPLWYELEGDECAQELVAVARALWAEQGQARRERWLTCWSMYEDRRISDEAMTDPRILGTRYNVLASVIDTAVSEIASRQRPKPTFVTSGADWRTKRKARKLDKFVEAHLHQPQGARYADMWELAEDLFRDAAVTGVGMGKLIIDEHQERVRVERVPAYEILVDANDAAGGDPRTWIHVYEMDAHAAEAAFAPSGRSSGDSAIRAKLEQSGPDMLRRKAATVSGRVSRQVTIVEAWHLSSDPDVPGRHVYACAGGMLWSEEWTWRVPPLLPMVWRRDPFGVWGVGLVETMGTQYERVNELADRLHRRYDLCAQKRTYYVPGMVQESQLEKSDGEVLIPVTDMSQVPREVQTPPVTPAEAMAVEDEIRRFYEISGVSQMSAQARKDPGVTSGIALQTLGDQKSVRFLPKSRAHELWFSSFGKLSVLGTRELARAKPGLIARWPGKHFVEEIRWSEVDLDEDMYEVRVTPTSALSRDPAQRLDVIQQLVSMQLLPPEKFLDLIGLPDLESALSMTTAEAQYVERLIDRYLDAEDDDELEELGGYQPADPHMRNPTAALVAVADAYFAAICDDAPEYPLKTMRQYMRDLQRLIIGKTAPGPSVAGTVPPNGGGGVPPGSLPAGLGAPSQLVGAA